MPSLFPKTHLIWFPLIASVNDGAVRACVMQDAAQVGDKDPKARLVHQGCSTSLGSGRDELFFFFSAPTWCIFHMQNACTWTICYPDPKEMSRRQLGPSPEGLGSPRGIVGTEGKGEQLDDSVNSCTERPKFPNRCDQQQLDTSL